MKTAIVYYSKHHGNTKKLLDAIAKKYEVTLIDVLNPGTVDLNSFDIIGFASGIYYSKFHKTLLKFVEENMPEYKKTFFIYTYGAKKDGYTSAINEVINKHYGVFLGEFGCYGFNTFGPFKLIGGIAKGHPDDRDLKSAVEFYDAIIS